ncbi:MAG: helix-turn-helix domain-containing protein [Kiritimatiellae bacterium]|nr:helix-turn-helix domain-containing protein [Kiritimatiellia bacterium]
MSPDKKYLSLEEVAELLGVNYQLIYRLARSGELPAVRLGRVYRVAESDLDAYLEKSKTSSSVARPAGTCAACGKTYRSEQALGESCAECGAPICVDCWKRLGVRFCREHQPAANDA